MLSPAHLFFTLSLLISAGQPAEETAEIASLAYVEDSASAWSLADILKQSKDFFTPLDGENIHLGLTRAPHWFRVELAPVESPRDVVLEFCNPRLGEVLLYEPLGDGAYREHVSGVRNAFWDREIPSLSAAFPLQLTAGHPEILYLLIRNSGSMRFQVSLLPATKHGQNASFILAFSIVVAAGLLVMAAHKFLIFLHLRETGYLWISVFLLACALRQMTASAVANMFLWPTAPFWSRHAMDITSLATMLAGIFMANNLLQVWAGSPRWARINVAFGLLAVVTGLLSLIDARQYLYLMVFTSLAIPFSITLYAIRAVRGGSRGAVWFLASWGTVLLGALVTSLVAPGFLPSNLVTEHLLDVALLGAGLSWSFTLTHQVKLRQEDQRRKLESQVRDRTAELEKALDAVRTLRGLVPICSCCKKIRNDDGFWEVLETYLREHTEADFSHGLCPDCAQSNYPAYFRGNSGGKPDGA